MKQKNKAVTLHEVRLLFENKFPELLAGAVDSPDEVSFRQKIDAYLSDASWNAEGVRVVRRLLEYDGRVVHELSVGEDVKVETLALLWRFLSGRIREDEISHSNCTTSFPGCMTAPPACRRKRMCSGGCAVGRTG